MLQGLIDLCLEYSILDRNLKISLSGRNLRIRVLPEFKKPKNRVTKRIRRKRLGKGGEDKILVWTVVRYFISPCGSDQTNLIFNQMSLNRTYSPVLTLHFQAQHYHCYDPPKSHLCDYSFDCIPGPSCLQSIAPFGVRPLPLYHLD